MAIRYVCLSDLHFGDVDSLLTPVLPDRDELDPSRNSVVAERLRDLLRAVFAVEGAQGVEPTLILNGDTLDLAFARTHEALTLFLRFLQLVNPDSDERLFGRVVYIPGNHDHHVWETARTDQYTEHLSGRSRKPPAGLPAPSMWYTTNAVDQKIDPMIPSRLIEAGFATLLGYRPVPHIEVAYPNFALVRNLAEEDHRVVVFNHGHSFEALYQAMTSMKSHVFRSRRQPRTVAQIESENFAWIDFVWSMLGRQGDVGSAVETFYKMATDSIGRKRLIDRLSSIPHGWLKRLALKAVLGWLGEKIGEAERNSRLQPLGDGTKEELREYFNGPVLEQLRGNGVKEVSDLTVILGHTHKPFVERMSGFAGYGGQADTYNTGGWVIEADGFRSRYGASVVFIDDDLNCSALDLFKELPVSFGSHQIDAVQARGGRTADNPVTTALKRALGTSPVSRAADAFLSALNTDMTMKLQRAQDRVETFRTV